MLSPITGPVRHGRPWRQGRPARGQAFPATGKTGDVLPLLERRHRDAGNALDQGITGLGTDRPVLRCCGICQGSRGGEDRQSIGLLTSGPEAGRTGFHPETAAVAAVDRGAPVPDRAVIGKPHFILATFTSTIAMRTSCAPGYACPSTPSETRFPGPFSMYPAPAAAACCKGRA
jgi:hypothetical protein